MWIRRAKYEELLREAAQAERLQAELAATQTENRRYIELLSNMAIRVPVHANQRPSDPFEEDEKLPTVWLTGDDIDPNEFIDKALSTNG